MALAQKYKDLAARAGWSAAGAFVAPAGLVAALRESSHD